MPWHARLELDYQLENRRSVARFSHDGPLRILQSLYPEGDAVCHNVLVHPPGGLVGGDTLDIRVHAAAGSHGLITTPGASRFYRSDGELALQRAELTLDAGWDVTALGLPNAGKPFEQGTLRQHIEAPGVWLERGRIDASDHRLLQSPLGFAGHRCIASIFFVAGSPIARERREAALDVARSLIDGHALQESAGATSPHAEVIVLRALAPVVEPAMQLLRKVWMAWRSELWKLPGQPPRIWAM
jgi:urease accessory protein